MPAGQSIAWPVGPEELDCDRPRFLTYWCTTTACSDSNGRAGDGPSYHEEEPGSKHTIADLIEDSDHATGEGR